MSWLRELRGEGGPVTLRYDRRSLRADYVRSVIGLALTWLPLLLVDAHPVVFWVLFLCGAVFAVFLLRTAQRQHLAVDLSDEGVRTHGPLGPNATIRWSELSALKLSFFAAKRRRPGRRQAHEERPEGWMQLTLAGGRHSVKLESTLDDFDVVVERAARAAAANRLDLGAATLANLVEMGVDIRPFTGSNPA